MWFPRTPPPPKLDDKHVDQWRSHDIRASMAYLYRLRYDEYLIVMNTTEEGTYRENTFELKEPKIVDRPLTDVLELRSGKKVDLTKPVEVEPQSTRIFYLGD